MNLLSGFRSLFLTVLLLILSFGLRAQVLLSESFEGSFPTAGWTFVHLGGGFGWTQNYYPNTGTNNSKSIVCSANPYYGANDWAFSPAVSLNTNTLYRISYWYRCSIFGGSTESLKVTIGNNVTVASQTSTIHNYPSLNNSAFAEGVDTITVSASGSYNIAFNYYSIPDQNIINLDSVVITKIIPTPCTGIPEIGVASAPSLVTKENDFKLSLSGNYLLYTGLQIQWQTSLAGENNFQNIIGANTQNFTTTQNVNRDYRCIVSCANGNTVATSNIVSIKLSDWGSGFREKFVGSTGGYINDMSFLTPSTGFVAFSRDIGFTQDSGQTFVRRSINTGNVDYNGYAINLTFGFIIRGVHAISKDSLLAYGDYAAGPAILFSANQGLTWKLVFHQLFGLYPDIGNSIFDLKFLTASNAIAVNLKEIIQTNDGGQTWNVLYHMDPFYSNSRFTKISAPTPDVFYVAAGDYIFKKIFSSIFGVPVPASTGLDYNNVSFVSESTGYITRKDNNGIYKTVDGGSSWSKMNNTITSPVYASDLHFINDSTGFAAYGDGYEVLKTTDNGVTWENCKKNTSYQYLGYGMRRLFFLNNETGWVGGLGEYLMLTTSGGSPTIPKAIFRIDTTNMPGTGLVSLLNDSRPFYRYKWYRNNKLIGSSYNATYLHNISAVLDTIKLVVENGTDSDSLIQYFKFNTPPYKPLISSFFPVTGSKGTLVAISGSGFTIVNSVKFGDIPADSFSVVNDNLINAIIGDGSSGKIAVKDFFNSAEVTGFTYFQAPTSPPPIIGSVSPMDGPVGTVVTITGNFFGTDPANNVISFGAVNAIVISASSTQLTCKVPAGASMEPVIVFNKSTALLGRSQKPYTVTFADSGTFTNSTFELATTIDYGLYIQPTKYPLYSIGKDIDGDGKPDLITAVKRYPDSIAVYRNTTNGNFINFDKNKNTGIVAAGVTKFRVEDIDGDGRADIAYAGTGGIKVARNLSNAGNVAFAPEMSVQNAVAGADMAIADLDADGKNDFVAATGASIQLTRNTSAPGYFSFGKPQTFGTTESADDVAAADIDGDGKIDVIVHKSTMLSCFRNISTLHNIDMAPIKNFTLPNGVPFEGKSMAITDFDLDGKLDVIVFDQVFFCVFINTSTPGDISFAPPVSTSLIDYFGDGWGGCVANLSGDSKPDVLTGSMLLFRNISTPGNVNTESGVYINPHYSSSMNTADFDGDGRMDVISTSINYSSTLIYRNKMGLPIDYLNCPGPNGVYADLQTNIGGASYQWQQDSGTGFKDLSDGLYFSGTNTPIITFKFLPSSYNGFQYRCKVDGNYSYTYGMKFGFEWTGYADTNWENPGNWSCGVVPDKYADVKIDGGTVNVNTDAEVRSIYLTSGTQFIVKAGKTFKVLK